jgi:hypothetical protein
MFTERKIFLIHSGHQKDRNSFAGRAFTNLFSEMLPGMAEMHTALGKFPGEQV